MGLVSFTGLTSLPYSRGWDDTGKEGSRPVPQNLRVSDVRVPLRHRFIAGVVRHLPIPRRDTVPWVWVFLRQRETLTMRQDGEHSPWGSGDRRVLLRVGGGVLSDRGPRRGSGETRT